MKLWVVGCALGAFAMCAGAAQAQVTQSYSYDGNGRLIGVTTSGVGGTHTSTYAYDKANNRVQRVRSGSASYAAVLSLPYGGRLSPDEALVSPDGRYTFAMRPSGRLELWLGDDRLWDLQDRSGAPRASSDADGSVLAFATSLSDAAWSLTDKGDLVASTTNGQTTLWSSAGSL